MFKTFVASSTEGRRIADPLVRAMEQHHSIQPVPWWQSALWTSGASTLECLHDMLPSVDLAVIVVTPDDLSSKRDRTVLSPRDNVLFEAGLASGRLGRHRAVILRVDDVELPTDLAGVTFLAVSENQLAGRDGGIDQDKVDSFVTLQLVPKLLEGESQDDCLMRDVSRNLGLLEPSARLDVLRGVRRDRLAGYRRSPVGMKTVSRVFQQYCRSQAAEVGATPTKSMVSAFIDTVSLTNDTAAGEPIAILSNAVGRIIARTPASNFPTRIAVHHKKDLGLTHRILSDLNEKPVLVGLESTGRQILGSKIPRETAIFFQDITTSGQTPLACISRLRAAGVEVRTFVTLVGDAEHWDELKNNCKDAGIRLHCLLKRCGTRFFVVRNKQ